MVLARFAPILFVLAIAGALAAKRTAPAGLGTMRTDTPTFVVLLIGVIVLVGALTFFPALLLGPDRPGPDRRASSDATRPGHLRPGASLAFTLLFGLAYPLAITGVAQVAFPAPARTAIGATDRGATSKGDPRYFQPRPSTTDYSADGDVFTNLGPNSKDAARHFDREPGRLPQARAAATTARSRRRACPSTR